MAITHKDLISVGEDVHVNNPWTQAEKTERRINGTEMTIITGQSHICVCRKSK